MKRVSKFLLLLSVTVLMAGCKLAVIAVEGGEVQSEGSGTCIAGTVCIVEVTDSNFSEIFTAIPNTGTGWYFQKWNSGDRFFCGGSKNPICTLSFQGHEESKEVQDMVESSEVFYLMPVFRPVKDTIKVDGKEWYQPYLFEELSWNDVKVVCPDGKCNGTLKGYDLTGWTWASYSDVQELLNNYGFVDGWAYDPYTTRESSLFNLSSDGWLSYGEPLEIGKPYRLTGLLRDGDQGPVFLPVTEWGYEASQAGGFIPDHWIMEWQIYWKEIPKYVGRGVWLYREL